MHHLIVDKMTGTILDATECLLVEADTDDLDIIEDIVNNWGPDAALKTAHDLGWVVIPLAGESVDVEAAVNKAVLDVTESFELAMKGERIPSSQRGRIQNTVEDALANNWDELMKHFG